MDFGDGEFVFINPMFQYKCIVLPYAFTANTFSNSSLNKHCNTRDLIVNCTNFLSNT